MSSTNRTMSTHWWKDRKKQIDYWRTWISDSKRRFLLTFEFGRDLGVVDILQKHQNLSPNLWINSNCSETQDINLAQTIILIFQKSSKKKPKSFKIIITLELFISTFNTNQNIIFQKSSYKNRPITEGPKFLNLLYSTMKLNITAKANKLKSSDSPYLTFLQKDKL